MTGQKPIICAVQNGPLTAVVADDLTGAADTAIQFLDRDGEILLVDVENPPTRETLSGAAGLALNTASRASRKPEIVKSIKKAAELLSSSPCRLIYKKVDSQMRGLPGLEIETLRRLLDLDCAFIAPAFPEQGRTTRDGIHYVHGVPAAQGEAGRDPVTPVTESDLTRLVSTQAGAPAGLVSWQEMDLGLENAARRIEALTASGVKLIIFDVLHRGHLELIARLSLERFPGSLPSGSAGLAGSIAPLLGLTKPEPPKRLPPARRLLFICGSQSLTLRRQAEFLAASGRCREMVITSERLSWDWEAFIQRASEIWARENLLVRLSERTFGINPSELLEPLSDLALTLIKTRRPDGLFLSGGDTARAVLLRAGVAAFRLKAEAVPGTAWGYAELGELHGAALASKSGAFGRDDLLIKLHEKWIEEI